MTGSGGFVAAAPVSTVNTVDFITVFADVCKKNSKIIYSAASATEDFCLIGLHTMSQNRKPPNFGQ